MKDDEGETKYKENYTKAKALTNSQISELNRMRNLLFDCGFIGQDNSRYKGYGYGNASCRMGTDQYIITGRQTGGIERLTNQHYTVVLDSKSELNSVDSKGPIRASSEAMTHGVLYKLDRSINFVCHGHYPLIWNNSDFLELPTTNDHVKYGTPEMADEVRRLYRESNLKDKRIFSMGGHEDGIISFGADTFSAVSGLFYCLANVNP